MIKENLGKCNAYIKTFEKEERITNCIYIYDCWNIKPSRFHNKVRQTTVKNPLSISEYMEKYDAVIEPNVTRMLEFYIDGNLDKVECLYSYDSLIAIYIPEHEVYFLFPLWKYSTTTRQHLSKFMRKNGHDYCTDDFKPENGVYFAYGYASGAWIWRY